MGLLVARAGPAVVGSMLARVGWAFPVTVLLYGGHQAVRAAALRLSIVGWPLRFAETVRIRISAEAIDALTFTGPFLAEPAKGWLLMRCGVSVEAAFGAVAVEYLLYTTVSAVTVAVTALLLIARGVVPPAMQPAAYVAFGGAITFVAAVAFAAVSGVGLVAPFFRALHPLAVRLRIARAAVAADWVGRVECVLMSLLHDRPARALKVLALEVVAHTLFLLEIWIVLATLGFSLTGGDLLVVEGGVKLTQAAFFFIPGQLGASEAGYLWLVGSLGLPAAAGLTLALVRRARSFAVAGAGLLALALLKDSGAPPENDRPRP